MNAGYYHSLYEQAVAGPASPRPLPVSQRLLERAQAVIPGAAQTFSKSTSQYVQRVSPVFLQRGEGCRVWDVDGHAYIDYVQGLLPNILGYGCQAVDDAFHAQARHGHSFSLPHPLEVELAERLTRIIPCAEMVRFCKNGSDATAGAVRVARAFTGREHIACCGYHGWQDWYIGSTTRNGGVPQAVRDLTHPFAFNNLASLEAVFAAHPGGVAAVIMEPFNFTEPQPGFLEAVRDLAHRHGALLIYDEICTGFHFGLGGVQKIFGVTPDLACFGKAMGNGYPIACIAGRRDVMKVFEDVFFSFTFGGEVASMAAAMAVLDILEHTDALQRIEAQGRRIQDGFNALAQEAGLYPRFECVGRPQWSLMKFRNAEGQDSLLERSLFQQEAIKRGILHLVTHNMTAAHDDAAVDQTLTAYAAVFKTLALWLADSQPTRFLEGPMIQPVFRVR
jgi:glutamate-1-semialdehyde 2,1-aminomutase/spore coat polysaccharide biosynthesis protein SpsF